MLKIQITHDIMKEFLTNDKVTKIEGLSENQFTYYYQLIKIDLNEKFYMIYMARHWFSENKTFIPDKIEVCGYIKKSNKHLYSPNYYLTQILDNFKEKSVIQYTNFVDLNFNDVLSKQLTQEIKNNWEELRNEKYKNNFTDIEYAKKTRAKEKAIKWVVEDHLYVPPEYQYNIQVNMEAEDYIEYLSNPQEYIQNKIKKFMSDKDELALFFESIITYESAIHQMSDILNNPDIQHERNIKDALKELETKYKKPTKTVTIKVIKDNKEWFGKIDICWLKNCSAYNWISMYNCPKQDRYNFKKTFGPRADLYPEDIVEILFRNKTIYKKGE